MDYMHKLLRGLLRQGLLFALPLLVLAGCQSKKEVTQNDKIGSSALWQWVDGYVRSTGEIPTKEEYLENHIRDMREFFLSEGYPKEKVDEFISDSLGKEMDYLKTWPRLNDFWVGKDPTSMIIAPNYLLTHPSMKFINQDSCLLIVDSTLYLPNGEVASMTIPLPTILIKDSAYYFNGVRQPSIRAMEKAMIQARDSMEDVGGTEFNPIIVAFDSPVELIDTLRYYAPLLYIKGKGFGKAEKRRITNALLFKERQLIDSIVKMPFAVNDSVPESDRGDAGAFWRCKRIFMETVRDAKVRLYRSNDTIYLNGKPVDANYRLDADTSLILVDLTHDNTYRDLCELVRFMEKATGSASEMECREQGLRWRYYFKSDDKIYKEFEEEEERRKALIKFEVRLGGK